MAPTSNLEFPPRKILIKADDFTSSQKEGERCRWKMLNDLVMEKDIPISLGVIGSRIERNFFNEDEVLDSIRPGIGAGNIELFNHGFFHDKARIFRGSSLQWQQECIERTNALCEHIYGIWPDTFGAPFNFLDENTVKACSSLGMELVYFGSSGHGVIAMGERAKVNPGETNGEPFDPIMEVIAEQYDNRWRTESVLCIQIHPCRWTDQGFEVFSEIIDWLHSFGCEFINQSDYIREFDGREGVQNRIVPCEIESHLQSNIAERVREVVLDNSEEISSEYLKNKINGNMEDYSKILSDSGISEQAFGGPIRILDIGCGLGHMSLAFATSNRLSRVKALDYRKSNIGILEKIIDRSTLQTRIEPVTEMAENMEIAPNRFDASLMIVSLNYMLNHEEVIRRLSLSSKIGSRHLLRYHHNGHFFNREMQLEEVDKSRQWAREHAASTLYTIGAHGLEKPGQLALDSENIIALFNNAGFGLEKISRTPDISGNFTQSAKYIFVKEQERGIAIAQKLNEGDFESVKELYDAGHHLAVFEFLNNLDREDLDDDFHSLFIQSACRLSRIEVLGKSDFTRCSRPLSRALYSLATESPETALEDINGVEENIDSMFLNIALLCRMGRGNDARAIQQRMVDLYGYGVKSLTAHNLICAYEDEDMSAAISAIMNRT